MSSASSSTTTTTKPLPSSTPKQKLIGFDTLKPCGVACAEDGTLGCPVDDPECLCTSKTWQDVFMPCFLKMCPKEDYRYTAEQIRKICTQEGGGGLTQEFAKFILNLKALHYAPDSTTATPGSTPTVSETPRSDPTTPTLTNPSQIPSGTFRTDSPSSASSTDGTSTGVVVGISIGAGLGALFLILLGWFIYRRRSRRRVKGDPYDNADRHSPDAEKTRENYTNNTTPYSAHQIGTFATPSGATQFAVTQHPPNGVPPRIPAMLEADDTSVNQRGQNMYRR